MGSVCCPCSFFSMPMPTHVCLCWFVASAVHFEYFPALVSAGTAAGSQRPGQLSGAGHSDPSCQSSPPCNPITHPPALHTHFPVLAGSLWRLCTRCDSRLAPAHVPLQATLHLLLLQTSVCRRRIGLRKNAATAEYLNGPLGLSFRDF